LLDRGKPGRPRGWGPSAFGFDVPESFEFGSVGRTGIMNPPDPGERIIGGHAVLAQLPQLGPRARSAVDFRRT
jgi:hypothetical protein